MNQTFTVAPGDSITIIGGQAGSSTTPIPSQPPTSPGGSSPPPSGPAGTVPIDLAPLVRQRHVILPGQLFAAHFRTGSKGTQPNFLPNINGAETVQGGPRSRLACISKTPGDFTNPVGGVIAGPSPSSTIHYSIAPGAGGDVSLEQDTDYYFNVKLADDEVEGGEMTFYWAQVGYLL